ncbi:MULTISPECIES: hypothetical protein [unclassified Paenibacillus]|uniref:hypothetical protein n=1 Tax=unclassified Paenibacillus TaxID=185978 RepID=UPI0015C49264|nr:MULTISPECIES: hypothetical protein [unclassified Paenibacillus]
MKLKLASMFDVTIIGGGPAGLFSALRKTKNPLTRQHDEERFLFHNQTDFVGLIN